jgi:hypothetical protein
LDRQTAGGVEGIDVLQMLEDGTLGNASAGGVPAVEGVDFNQLPRDMILNSIGEKTNERRGTRA